MDILAFLLVLCLLQTCNLSLSKKPYDTLVGGSSLSVEKTIDALTSPNSVFSAGFFNVGDHAFCFAIWFTNSAHSTVVWMANRDLPVGARNSKLSVLKNGNVILEDANGNVIWTTNTSQHYLSSVQLQLLNNGNLVLRTIEGLILWESFNSPTDTLLPQQRLTKDTYLISSSSQTSYTSGNYKLFFDNNNVLSLLFQDGNVTSIYWPNNADTNPSQFGRITYNSSRIAVLELSGHFLSSDGFKFDAADYGIGPVRRLRLDPDGFLRLYSLEQTNGYKSHDWIVSWQVKNLGCKVHGLCGPNGVCGFDPGLGRRCFCLTGFKAKNLANLSEGCEPEFMFSCDPSKVYFLKFSHLIFYSYDEGSYENVTLKECEAKCLKLCSCKGFQYKFNEEKSSYYCYHKSLLFNGWVMSSFTGDFYLKVTRGGPFFNVTFKESKLVCLDQPLDKKNQKAPENGTWKTLLWFASIMGVIEVTFILLMRCFLYFKSNQDPEASKQSGRGFDANGFKKFTYAELKKATNGFREEIGRGGCGVVYKAQLSIERVAAVKRLNETANHAEAEFLAELKTIGKLNHMNLIKMWGYCAEGTHRLLVYEYMEHGSLADNLSLNLLDWEKRFEIAIGTAKGLAYLHDECLHWVLHCDIKPQNILLDSEYRPKVSDFGLSKLLNRGGLNDSTFSKIRGTRGYMAPEWVYNLPITSKVDVYSYGVVLLEIITGKSPVARFLTFGIEGVMEHRRLVTMVRMKMNEAPKAEAWIEEIVDPRISSKYDTRKMEVLVKVALQCVEEERDARPTMRQVVEMLLRNNKEHA